jgi:hypothetical protein
VFSRWKALVDLCRPPGLDGAQVARNTFITLVEEVDFEAVAVDAAQNGRGGSFVVLIFVLATFVDTLRLLAVFVCPMQRVQ